MRQLFILTISAILAGCGSSEQAHAPPPVKDTAYGDAVDAMNKAKALEETTMKRKDDLDHAIDANEQGRDH